MNDMRIARQNVARTAARAQERADARKAREAREVPAKRITFQKVTEEHDYVDARFAVLLDGAKIGEVTANVETRDLDRGTTRMLARMSAPSKRWSAEGVINSDNASRVDAVIDLLMYRKDGERMDFGPAARLAGKKGW